MALEPSEAAARPAIPIMVPECLTDGEPTHIVMMHSTGHASEKDYSKVFPARTIVKLSVIQLIFATVVMVSQILLIVWNYDEVRYMVLDRQRSSHNFPPIWPLMDFIGIWCGFVFGLSGLFGMWVGCRPSLCSIITFMVFSIIAALFCIPLITISATGIERKIQRNSFQYRPPQY